MDLMMYHVSPQSSDLDWDEDGPINLDLYVWAKRPSEAVKLWGEHYGYGEHGMIPGHLGIHKSVRVFEVPIMQSGTPSTIISWDDVREYQATDSFYVEHKKE